MAKLIPEPIRMATAPGIGVFLAHLGLQTEEGIGLVVSDIATAVTLGACPPENRTPIVAYDDACANEGVCTTSDAYTCDVLGGRMTSPTTWIGILGFIIMIVFLSYKRNYGIIVGIFFVTIISWFRNTATFLYVDFLETTGTFLGLVTHMGLLDENGDFPRSRLAFSADAIATMTGSLFGLSPVTSFVESAAGVEAGGKTGVTALMVGFYFLLSIFFAPIFASIPPWGATGGSLVLWPCAPARKIVSFKTLHLKLPASRASGEESHHRAIDRPTPLGHQSNSSTAALPRPMNARALALQLLSSTKGRCSGSEGVLASAAASPCTIQVANHDETPETIAVAPITQQPT
eukprot:scaffold116387_cov101-Cyclotella_meneghiniana.AAC.1